MKSQKYKLRDISNFLLFFWDEYDYIEAAFWIEKMMVTPDKDKHMYGMHSARLNEEHESLSSYINSILTWCETPQKGDFW